MFLATVQVAGVPLIGRGQGSTKAKAKTAAASRLGELILKHGLVAAHAVPADIEVRVRI